MVHPVRQAQQRQVPDEVRHAGRSRAAPVHRNAGDGPDQKNRIPGPAEVPVLCKQVPRQRHKSFSGLMI